MKLIWTAEDQPAARHAGGKAAALARIIRSAKAEDIRISIPPWFAIASDAVDSSGALSAEMQAAIAEAIADLPGDGLFAVRSSAVDEDGSAHSFAGQLESYLFVRPGDVARRASDVIRSGFTARVKAYRKERGVSEHARAPAVLVQRMIDADVAGVAFAADAVSGSRSTIVIASVFGLGTSLVGGESEADTFRVCAGTWSVESQIAHKSFRHIADDPGVRDEPLPPDLADSPTLTNTQATAVAGLAMQVSRLECRPQDIEWAIKGDRLYLLQSRPITSLASVADPAGRLAIWDNSNIAESYNGITTPLTFSFAQRAYDGVYREFCKLMKVPSRVIADNDAMFGQMLGLIRGRIYYNLINWYRLLAMLPGYAMNQKFMEQMMGVRQSLPPEAMPTLAKQTFAQRSRSAMRVFWSVLGLVGNHIALPGKIKAFYRRLNGAMAAPSPPLREMRLDQLAAEFRLLESRLISRWDAPLINDFLAMIFFGALGKITAKWCPGEANLHNDLIGDEGGIISTEPARLISAMATVAAKDPALLASLRDDPIQAAKQQIAQNRAFGLLFTQYIEKFGDRCLEELKLESSTLHDDPTPLVRSIAQAAGRPASSTPYRPRAEAEKKLAVALKGRPIRWVFHRWLLSNARCRVRDRENLRFERTRLFGRVRMIFVEIGKRLYAEGLLQEPRDIFYLTLGEILSFIEGTSCDVELSALTRRRTAQFERFRQEPAPADRFETRGTVYVGNRFTADAVDDAATFSGQLQGTGCCPGIVRGPVRLVRDPRGAHLMQGEILVAERTDPGWILLFPAAAGILVERGSLLSHSAIVAREMGIPAIVSIPSLMQSLHDGDVVEMNGATGLIRRLEQP